MKRHEISDYYQFLTNVAKLKITSNEYKIIKAIKTVAYPKEDEASPSLNWLADITGLSKHTIINVSKSLIAKGYITKKQRMSKEKGNMSNIYSLKPLNDILEGLILKNRKIREEKCQKNGIIG